MNKEAVIHGVLIFIILCLVFMTQRHDPYHGDQIKYIGKRHTHTHTHTEGKRIPYFS